MAKITPQELLKLAQISQISVEENDIMKLVHEMDEILNYAAFLQEIARDKKSYEFEQNRNILREDIIIKTDPETILQQAPDRQENYFVVPVILKQS